MPIWLRIFTSNKLKEYYQKEAEAYENSSKSPNTERTTLKIPDYVSKARK
jgi:hypothetical protein